jgi:hypothetical protein
MNCMIIIFIKQNIFLLFHRCLEIQTNFLDLSSMKTIKHLATILDLLSSRSTSISGRN